MKQWRAGRGGSDMKVVAIARRMEVADVTSMALMSEPGRRDV